jgi:alkyl hydroperoxide reductase subunit AhpC
MMSLLTIGDQFPAYAVTAVAGGDLSNADAENPYDHFITASSGDHAGQWRVIFFWSRDVVRGGPTEIAAFGELNDRFGDRRAQVLGVSVDNKYSQFYWRTHHDGLQRVPFPMLSDFNRVLAAAVGVLNSDGIADRATFIVDPNNEIRYVAVSSGSADRNIGGILQVLDDLQSEDLRAGDGRGRRRPHHHHTGGAHRAGSRNDQLEPRSSSSRTSLWQFS